MPGAVLTQGGYKNQQDIASALRELQFCAGGKIIQQAIPVSCEVR